MLSQRIPAAARTAGRTTPPMQQQLLSRVQSSSSPALRGHARRAFNSIRTHLQARISRHIRPLPAPRCKASILPPGTQRETPRRRTPAGRHLAIRAEGHAAAAVAGAGGLPGRRPRARRQGAAKAAGAARIFAKHALKKKGWGGARLRGCRWAGGDGFARHGGLGAIQRAFEFLIIIS